MKQSTFHKKFTTWFNMLLTRNRVIFKFTLKTLPYSCQYKTPINLQMTENLWWLSMIDLEAVSEEMVFRKFYASSIQTKPFNYRKIASIKKYKRMWLTSWGIVSVSLKKKKKCKKSNKGHLNTWQLYKQNTFVALQGFINGCNRMLMFFVLALAKSRPLQALRSFLF